MKRHQSTQPRQEILLTGGGSPLYEGAPEEGARREFLEESGLEIDGELEIVGCFPMRVYGYDTLQISYRGRVVEGEAISHEHDGARWAKASDMRALLTDDVVEQISGGRDDIRSILNYIRIDRDRYLAKVSP